MLILQTNSQFNALKMAPACSNTCLLNIIIHVPVRLAFMFDVLYYTCYEMYLLSLEYFCMHAALHILCLC